MEKKTKKQSNSAVIRVGGSQFLVNVGSKIKTNRLQDKKIGDTVDVEILMKMGDKVEVGAPLLKNKAVLSVLEHTKAKKIKGMRFKAKSRYRRRYGHRQKLTVLEVKKL